MATQSSNPGFWYLNPSPGMSKYLFSHQLELGAPSSAMPPCSDAVKRLKRCRVFDSSLGVLGFLFAAICVLCFFFYLNHGVVHGGFRFFDQSVQFAWLKTNGSVPHPKVNFLEREGDGCDVFDGGWVWDEAYPLYQSRDCGFMDDGFRCSENGRPDLFYTKWRWQPKDCNLPRFNAKLMLEKLRNKRIVFVGDSIGRNQWESLLCMLSSAVLNKDSIYEVNGSPITKHKGSLLFKFREYNCTVEYYRAPFLVLQSRPPARSPRKIKTTLKVDKMDWNSDKWRDADLLLLNSGHWWNYEKTLRGGCYFQEGDEVKMEMRVVNAYKRSMETVVNWIHREVNINRTQVFFRTYAPVHFRGENWKNGGHCHFEVLPEEGSSLVPQEIWAGFHIITDVLSATQMNTPGAAEVTVLNITAMSARRKDGHSSLYYLRPNKGPVSRHRQDCSHWCLPGVPDAWNELLYALFLKREAATHLPNS